MNLIIVADLSAPPVDSLAFRFITMVSKTKFNMDILLETEQEVKDSYYKFLKKQGLFDFFDDIIPPGSENGIRLDRVNNIPVTIKVKKGIFFDNQVELINKIGRLL